MRLNSKKAHIIACAVASTFSSKALSGDELRVVRVSKEELAAAANPQFIVSKDLSDVLSSRLKDLAVTLTSRQSGNNAATRDAVAAGNQMSKALWMKKLSTLAFEPENHGSGADENKVRSTISAQSRKSAEVNFKNAFPVIARIQKGLSFNLDLKNPGSAVARDTSVPEIRYGLVETDILPSDRQIPVASYGTISEIDARYSSPAKVVYTIDRLETTQNKTVFESSSTTESGAQETQNVSMWSRLPSSAVRVKFDAADQNSAVADQVSARSAAPAMRVTLTQADGLVSTQMVTGAKESMTTEFKAPLYGEMSMARKYDSKFKATETSAQNILGHSSLPRLNLIYAHNAKSAKGEWIVKRDRFEYSVTAEPRQGWVASGDSALGKVGDKVTLAVNTSF
jgi:hypothetical protein